MDSVTKKSADKQNTYFVFFKFDAFKGRKVLDLQ